MKTQIWLAALIALAAVVFIGPAWSMGSSTPAEDKSAPQYKAGEAAIKAWKWTEAIGHLEKALALNPTNANAHNLLGYAYRNLKKYDKALKHYNQALKIDPEHRGAHEYIGQAYLQMKKLAEAQKHLDALDNICFMPCDEFDELKAAVATYRKNNKGS